MAGTHLLADVHLSPTRPATVDLLLGYLAGPAREAEQLFILGDLFDAWVGDDDDSALASAVQAHLRRLTASGTAVSFQAGNRDFLLGEAFAAATGVTLLDEHSVQAIAGVPTLLMHGDLLCTDDVEYQQARQMLRNPAFIADFLAKPLAERRALAQAYRQRSGEATSLKAEDIMDVNATAVADALRQAGVHRLIHGHTHRPACHDLTLDGAPAQRWVLAEWHAHAGEVLVADANGLHREPITP